MGVSFETCKPGIRNTELGKTDLNNEGGWVRVGLKRAKVKDLPTSLDEVTWKHISIAEYGTDKYASNLRELNEKKWGKSLPKPKDAISGWFKLFAAFAGDTEVAIIWLRTPSGKDCVGENKPKPEVKEIKRTVARPAKRVRVKTRRTPPKSKKLIRVFLEEEKEIK